jgi:hypothetical protein
MSLFMMRTLVKEYEHIHTTIGIVGNLLFVVGSVLFFRRSTSTTLLRCGCSS